MPTRQTSSSGRPKSPRIQVVLPEDLCQRLALLAEDESRTVSNMAKVLIQQGVERLEHLRQQDTGVGASSPISPGLPAAAAVPPAATAPPPVVAPPTAPPPTAPASTVPPPTSAPSAPPPAAARAGVEGSGSGPVPGSDAAADRFRAELERHEAQGPRRLRGVPRRLRLRPPGG